MSSLTRTLSSQGLALAMCLLVGTILRSAAARGELWLDEIWSLVQLIKVSDPLDILLVVRHDNNHLLNSLWMWMLPSWSPPWLYRLPAIVASAALVFIVGLSSALVPERTTRSLWSFLCAVSFPLVLLGSEARGYGIMLLCATVLLESCARMNTSPRDLRPAFTFAVSGAVGCFTHAIFCIPLWAASLWLIYVKVYQGTKAPSLTSIRTALALPGVVGVLLLFIFYSRLEVGGAPELPYLHVLISTLRVSLGLPDIVAYQPVPFDVATILSVIITTALLLELLAWIAGGSQTALLLGLVFLLPAILIPLGQPAFILSRYFVVQILCMYLLLARLIRRLRNYGALGLTLSWSLLALFIAGNIRHTAQLISLTRSHSVEIFQMARELSTNREVSFGGDQDIQNKIRVRYEGLRFPDRTPLNYIEDYRDSATPPEFILQERLPGMQAPEIEFTLSNGAHYTLVRSYKSPTWSGADSFLYRRE